MSQAVNWLEEKGATGHENAFYFLNLVTEEESEAGWIVSIFCGKEKIKK